MKVNYLALVIILTLGVVIFYLMSIKCERDYKSNILIPRAVDYLRDCTG